MMWAPIPPHHRCRGGSSEGVMGYVEMPQRVGGEVKTILQSSEDKGGRAKN
jgi:hypothetical protein